MKTNELTGPALDWAVAKCEGLEVTVFDDVYSVDVILPSGDHFFPSTNWAQGGPIIEREEITLRHYPHFKSAIEHLPARWCAELDHVIGGLTYCAEAYGPTPLIAAMRCYVASKLGDEVDVPGELT